MPEVLAAEALYEVVAAKEAPQGMAELLRVGEVVALRLPDRDLEAHTLGSGRDCPS
jgi:hypothetical protein